ncbi:MAG TPA: thioredoxin family protein [Polyangiaceae bacterium]|nr:thioredoxin family protein [Polyangiaceae bacterium]
MMPRIRVVATIALSALTLAGCRKDQSVPKPDASGYRGEQYPVGSAPAPPNNPKELGWVRWHRNYDEAAALAARTGKPLLLLFQEVPGCSTCVGFGETVLAHPLLVEAIETEFVPVAIHNNEPGHDRAIVERFGEPTWNNPVVRFVNAEGEDLIPRADGVWSSHGIAVRMVEALVEADRDVPDYLSWVVQETTPTPDRATFAMHCYWSGEACLGDIPGVVAASAGWLNGREVVEVQFDPDVLTEAELRDESEARGCGDFMAHAGAARPASDSDRKYHLGRSRWRYVPLTPWQASRVNAALGRQGDPMKWVSPRQRGLYQRIAEANSEVLDGLERPDNLRELAAYQRELLARLRR